jgi:Uma2 family endonuclease
VRQQKLGRILAEQEYEFKSDVYGPDVSFIAAVSAEAYEGKRRVQLFVPALAIEITSKNDRFESLLAKAYRYRECGTKEVYIFSIATRQVFDCSHHPVTVLEESRDFRPEMDLVFPSALAIYSRGFELTSLRPAG